MTKYFDEDNGGYRNHGEGVKRGNEVIYSAPQSILVPSLMRSLFCFMIDNENEIHSNTPFVGILSSPKGTCSVHLHHNI